MIQGIFISVWDNGSRIATPAVLNEETGEITSESVDIDIDGCLMRETFIDNNDNEYEVCPECHEYILNEKEECKNPNCH